MHLRTTLVLGIALLAPAGLSAAPVTQGHPAEFPGNGYGPPQGWFPGGGNSDKKKPNHGSSSLGGEWTDTEGGAPGLSAGPPIVDSGFSAAWPEPKWLPDGDGSASNSLPFSANSSVPSVNAVPTPSTLLLSISALGLLAGIVTRRRQ